MQKLDYEFFCHPKIVSGSCSLESIPTELASNDAYKPLVIAGRDCGRRGLNKALIRAFYDSGCPLGGIYDEVRDYAGIGLAQEAAILFSERGCDSIIALGSGPVVDVARAVNLLVSTKTNDLFQFCNGTPIKKRLKPFVLIPTCGLNGMEAGRTMTVDHRQVNSEFLFPDAVIIDKRMIPAESGKCVAESASLAIDNAITAFADREDSPMKDAFAHTCLQLISGNLEKTLEQPGSRTHGLAMANACILGGIAAANARPGLAGVLSRELEKATSISRAVFTSVIAPAVLANMQEEQNPPVDKLLLAAVGMDIYSATPEDQRLQKAISVISDFFEQTRRAIPETSALLQIPRYKLEKACEIAATMEGTDLNAEDCLAVLDLAWKGAAG